MNVKTLKIIGTIIAFMLCFPLHNLYKNFPNIITSIFSPVNESIWEHMKILFGSIIISGVLQKIYIKITKLNLNNICFSNFIAAISSIPVFLILFIPIYKLIGENFIITILIMLISIIISEYISYIIINKTNYYLENKTIFFCIFIYIIFGILTYFPLKSGLFIDTTNNTYGIKKTN